MHQGRVQTFGPKDEVLAKVMRHDGGTRPLKVVPETGSAKP
jgi:ABC-type protease/lipase transport system fused ATPase/permease subunit